MISVLKSMAICLLLAMSALSGVAQAQLPQAKFTGSPVSGSLPLICTFDSTASYFPPGATNIRYDWDFGDGNKSTDQNPVHTYRVSGQFTVTLQVKCSLGRDYLVRKDYIVANTSGPAVSIDLGGSIILGSDPRWVEHYAPSPDYGTSTSFRLYDFDATSPGSSTGLNIFVYSDTVGGIEETKVVTTNGVAGTGVVQLPFITVRNAGGNTLPELSASDVILPPRHSLIKTAYSGGTDTAFWANKGNTQPLPSGWQQYGRDASQFVQDYYDNLTPGSSSPYIYEVGPYTFSWGDDPTGWGPGGGGTSPYWFNWRRSSLGYAGCSREMDFAAMRARNACLDENGDPRFLDQALYSLQAPPGRSDHVPLQGYDWDPIQVLSGPGHSYVLDLGTRPAHDGQHLLRAYRACAQLADVSLFARSQLEWFAAEVLQAWGGPSNSSATTNVSHYRVSTFLELEPPNTPTVAFGREAAHAIGCLMRSAQLDIGGPQYSLLLDDWLALAQRQQTTFGALHGSTVDHYGSWAKASNGGPITGGGPYGDPPPIHLSRESQMLMMHISANGFNLPGGDWASIWNGLATFLGKFPDQAVRADNVSVDGTGPAGYWQTSFPGLEGYALATTGSTNQYFNAYYAIGVYGDDAEAKFEIIHNAQHSPWWPPGPPPSFDQAVQVVSGSFGGYRDHPADYIGILW